MMNGGLPEGWAMSTLGQITGPSSEKAEPNGKRVPYLSLEHIESNTNRIIGRGDSSEVRSTKSVFHKGDVLYGKLRPYLNKVAVVDFDGVCSTDILVFPKSSHVESKLLMWFLSQPFVVAFANHNSTGIQLPRTSFSSLADLDFPLPPLDEQRRIVATLEALIAKVSANRQRLDHVQRVLERFRESVLAAACSGRLTADWRESAGPLEAAIPTAPKQIARTRRRGANLSGPTELLIDDMPEIPTSWRYVRHDWLAAPGTVITYGIVLPGPEIPDGVPYVRQQDIQDGWIRTNELRHTTKTIAARHPRSSLAHGDVLLCIIRNLRVAVVPQSLDGANITQGAVRIRPDTRYIDAEYLALYLASRGAQGWMRRRYFGMDMPRINVEDARAVPIAVPPMQEQLEIVRRAKDLLTITGCAEQRLDTAATALEQLTNALLAKAFRGELVPTEAELAGREGREYEPASVLLDRIATGSASRNNGSPPRRESRSVSQRRTKRTSPPVGGSTSRRRQHDVA